MRCYIDEHAALRLRVSCQVSSERGCREFSQLRQRYNDSFVAFCRPKIHRYE